MNSEIIIFGISILMERKMGFGVIIEQKVKKKETLTYRK
jgi:hypothetical protein